MNYYSINIVSQKERESKLNRNKELIKTKTHVNNLKTARQKNSAY